MIISYDSKYNIAYIKIKEKDELVDTLKISEELNIDISPDGKVYGIELLNANEQLNLMDNNIIFINENEKKEKRFSII